MIGVRYLTSIGESGFTKPFGMDPPLYSNRSGDSNLVSNQFYTDNQ